MQAAEDYMEQVTEQMRREDRRQILATTPEDLEKVSRLLDEICEKGGSCIVGGQEILAAAGVLFRVLGESVCRLIDPGSVHQ